MRSHTVERVHEERVGGRRVDRVIEPGDEVVVAVLVGEERFDVGEFGAQRLELGAVPAARGKARGLHLERLADLEQFRDILGGHVGDDHAAAGVRADQALGGEPGEGFAQGRAGHPEPLRLLDLGEHGAGAEFGVQDLAPERQVGTVARTKAIIRDGAHVYTVTLIAPKTTSRGPSCIQTFASPHRLTLRFQELTERMYRMTTFSGDTT